MKKTNSHAPQAFAVEQPTELLDFLLKAMNHLSRNAVKSLLTKKAVRVNGRVVTQYNQVLHRGDSVHIGQRTDSVTLPGIVYEDDALLAYNKPAGLLTIADAKERTHTAYRLLTDYVKLQNSENRLFIVHRLDRETSGIVVFAKSEVVKRILQDNWEERALRRDYTAVVEGCVEPREGRLHHWLLETKTRLMYAAQTPGDGLEAITDYQIMQTGNDYSLLTLTLHTGRKNQIRVQLKEIGYPIVGDKKYGAASNPLKRLALHAHLLEIKHPVSNEPLTFSVKPPASFAGLLK